MSYVLKHTATLLLPVSIRLCAAINLLGLTWQLKPSDGPVGAAVPVNSDVATLPSGGRGMNCRDGHIASKNTQ